MVDPKQRAHGLNFRIYVCKLKCRIQRHVNFIVSTDFSLPMKQYSSLVYELPFLQYLLNRIGRAEWSLLIVLHSKDELSGMGRFLNDFPYGFIARKWQLGN